MAIYPDWKRDTFVTLKSLDLDSTYLSNSPHSSPLWLIHNTVWYSVWNVVDQLTALVSKPETVRLQPNTAEFTFPLFSEGVEWILLFGWGVKSCRVAGGSVTQNLEVTLCVMAWFSPLRFSSRHIYSCESSRTSSVRGRVIPAEQCPQAGTPAPLDDLGSDLAACRYAHVHTNYRCLGVFFKFFIIHWSLEFYLDE